MQMKSEAYAKAPELDLKPIFAERSALSRLFIPTLFSLAVIAASLLFAEAYELPTSSIRISPLIDPAIASCIGTALINMVAFILWRRPELFQWFNKNMLVSAVNPMHLSTLGNVFSYQHAKHIFTHGFLFLAVPTVCEEIGRTNFIALFVISGVGANLVGLRYKVLVKNYLMASLVMPGAIRGIVAAYTLIIIVDRRRIGMQDWGVNYSGWGGSFSYQCY